MSAKFGKKGKGCQQAEDHVQLAGGKKSAGQIGKMKGEDLHVHDVSHSNEQYDGSKPARVSNL